MKPEPSPPEPMKTAASLAHTSKLLSRKLLEAEHAHALHIKDRENPRLLYRLIRKIRQCERLRQTLNQISA